MYIYIQIWCSIIYKHVLRIEFFEIVFLESGNHYGPTFVHHTCRRLVDEDVDETDTAFGGLSCWAFLTHRKSNETWGNATEIRENYPSTFFNMIFSNIPFIYWSTFFLWAGFLKQPIGVFKNQLPRPKANISKFMEFHLHPSGVMNLLIPILGESNKQYKSNYGNFEGISLITIHYLLVGGFKYFFNFQPLLWGNDPILTYIFQRGLNPPTRYIIWVGNIIALCPLRFWSSIFIAPLSVEDFFSGCSGAVPFHKFSTWRKHLELVFHYIYIYIFVFVYIYMYTNIYLFRGIPG